MKSRAIILSLFVVMAVVQWFVPLQMIRGNLVTLTTGKEYKFRLAPVDPVDPFRGNYLNLSFEANNIKIATMPEWEQGEEVFVILKEDELGFAQIKSLSKEKPNPEIDFITSQIQSVRRTDTVMAFIEYPFDRYYINEKMAGPIEKMIIENQADSTKLNYAVVRVKAGNAAVEKLYLDGIPVEEWYKKLR